MSRRRTQPILLKSKPKKDEVGVPLGPYIDDDKPTNERNKRRLERKKKAK